MWKNWKSFFWSRRLFPMRSFNAEPEGWSGCNNAVVLPSPISEKYKLRCVICPGDCDAAPCPSIVQRAIVNAQRRYFSHFSQIWQTWSSRERPQANLTLGITGSTWTQHRGSSAGVFIFVRLCSPHPCCRIHKHSVQVKDILIYCRCAYFPATSWWEFTQSIGFVLKTDISLSNRIPTVNAALNASHLSLGLDFRLYSTRFLYYHALVNYLCTWLH